MELVISLKAVYYDLGRALRLKAGDLDAIRRDPGCDAKQALNDVLLLWLRQNYPVDKYGLPTWRLLVKAVDNTSGGNDHALAKTIAEKYPAGKCRISVCREEKILVYSQSAEQRTICIWGQQCCPLFRGCLYRGDHAPH